MADGGASSRRRKSSSSLISITYPGGNMEMTWDNLTKLFTWAAKKGGDAPYADTAGESVVIDGALTKEDFERFVDSQSESPR